MPGRSSDAPRSAPAAGGRRRGRRAGSAGRRGRSGSSPAAGRPPCRRAPSGTRRPPCGSPCTPRPSMPPIRGSVFGPRTMITMIRTTTRTTRRVSIGRMVQPHREPAPATERHRAAVGAPIGLSCHAWPDRPRSDDPLLVFGPRSTTYDFGPGHPLTPRRFGPGIDLLRAVGAEPGLAPEPATDEELLAVHTAAYLAAVRRLRRRPDGGPPAFGIAPFGDVPPFAGMHEASAAVAGGSLRAIEAILRGDVAHAFHPGGGLHHAMPARASGFCVYNDVALAVAAARRDGAARAVRRPRRPPRRRGGGDPRRRSGRADAVDPRIGPLSLPGQRRGVRRPRGGGRDRRSTCRSSRTTGETAWLAAVRSLVPDLAAAFRPDIVVSQHGADSHAWDPLAHLRVTTTAMGAAARLVDEVAHRHAGGRWLATGGGGYDVYRVVPRAWALTWLAGAHREPPPAIPGRVASAVDRRGGGPRRRPATGPVRRRAERRAQRRSRAAGR